MTVRTGWALIAALLWVGAATASPPATPAPPAHPPIAEVLPSDAVPVSPPRRGAVELEAGLLLWRPKPAPVPALLTTSDTADLGVLGAATTRVVVGGSVDFKPVTGARFASRFVADCGIGLSLGAFFVDNDTPRSVTVSGLPVLAVPIIDPTSGANSAIRLAGPGAATGAAQVRVSSGLWGREVNGLYRLKPNKAITFDVLAGYRYLELNETFALATTTTIEQTGFFVGQVTPVGSTYTGLDSFATRNVFSGGQAGFRGQFDWGPLSVSGSVLGGYGQTRQSATVSGSTTLAAPGQSPATAPGNILTQTTNIGMRSRHQNSALSQLGVALGYRLADWALVTISYDYLFWNHVSRPGDLIDPQINPNLPPIRDEGTRLGPARPAAIFADSDYWAHALTIGLRLAF